MQRASLRPSYIARATSRLKLHLLPAFDAVPLFDITRAMVRGWWESLDLTKQCTNDNQLLRAIMNATQEDEHIAENPKLWGFMRIQRNGGPR